MVRGVRGQRSVSVPQMLLTAVSLSAVATNGLDPGELRGAGLGATRVGVSRSDPAP